MSQKRLKLPSNGFALPLILLLFTGMSLWLLTVHYELQKQQRRIAAEQIGAAFLWIAEQSQLHYQRTDQWPRQISDLVVQSEFPIDIAHLSAHYQLTTSGDQLRIYYASSNGLTLAALQGLFSWLAVDAMGAWLSLAPIRIVQTEQLIHLQNDGQTLQANIDMAGHDIVNAGRLEVAELAAERAVAQGTQSLQTTATQLAIGGIKVSAGQLQGDLRVDSLSNSRQIAANRVESSQMTTAAANFDQASVTNAVSDSVITIDASANIASAMNTQAKHLASENVVGEQVEFTRLSADAVVADTSNVDILEVDTATATSDVLVNSTRGLRGLYEQTIQLYDQLYECMYVTEACFPAQEPVLMVTCLECDGLGSMNYYTSTLVVSITGCQDTCDLRFELATRFNNLCEPFIEGPQPDKSFTCNIRGSVTVGEQLNHPVTLYAMQSGDPRTEVSQTIILTWRGI